MKVISGFLKGRNIEGYNIDGTRPTMDRVKESLFATIQNSIDNAIVLDLYAGTGSLGIEAISNGATKAYFIDNNKICIQCIDKHIALFNISDKTETYCMNDIDALKMFKEKNCVFDIVFLDPPYKYDSIPKIISFITNNKLLKKDGLIICELTNTGLIKEYDNLKIIKNKKYSDKYIIIYKNI